MRVRESVRIRSIRLIVRPSAQLEVVVPRGTDDQRIYDALESERDWLIHKRAVARAAAARPQLGLEQPGLVRFAGEVLPVDRRPGGRPRAELRDGQVLLSGSRETATAALERWFRRQARRLVLEVIEREAGRLEVECTSVGIRDSRTRWGSCSSSGHLSFSWRLALAPSEVLEYVVVHELLHLREHNHSNAFWRLLDEARPDWRRQARWLREHGHELHDYDLSAALGSRGTDDVEWDR